MTQEWVRALLEHPVLCAMGHAQRPDDQNLGLGWLYYALARLVRPARAVCIGSWRGFVPIVLGQALRDNAEGGRVTFIDPSLVDEFWIDPERTRDWFESFGLDNVEHHCVTTQEFVVADAYRRVGRVGLLFIDGFHSAEQARFDHEAFSSYVLTTPSCCSTTVSGTVRPAYMARTSATTTRCTVTSMSYGIERTCR